MSVIKYKNPETGLWEVTNGGGSGGSASIDVTAEVGQTIIVKEVDANGKPTKWESAEYQPRTHYSEVVKTDIVPETTFTPVYNEAFGIPVFSLSKFELVVGKEYTVIYDGVEYNCTAKSGNFRGLAYIGIGNEIFGGGENTGQPFAVTILTEMNMYLVDCMDMNEHTVKVVGETMVYHKIPDEYAPKSDFCVDVGGGMQGFVLYSNADDILNAILSNKNIYAKVTVRCGSIGDDEYSGFNYFHIISAEAYASGRLNMVFSAVQKTDNLSHIHGSSVNDVFPYGDLLLIEISSDGVTIETPNMPV